MGKNERAGLSKGEMEPDSFSTYPRDAIQCAYPRSPWRLRFVDRWLFHRLSIYLVQSLAKRLGGSIGGIRGPVFPSAPPSQVLAIVRSTTACGRMAAYVYGTGSHRRRA